MEPSLRKTNIRTSRVDRTCCECGQGIHAGERYRDDRGCWDGRWDSFVICMGCDSLSEALLQVVDPTDIEDGELWELAEVFDICLPLLVGPSTPMGVVAPRVA